MAISHSNPNHSPAWVILTGTIALAILLGQFLPSHSNNPVDNIIASYSAMLATGLFGFVLCRYLNRRGLSGFIVGSLIGFGLSQLALWL